MRLRSAPSLLALAALFTVLTLFARLAQAHVGHTSYCTVQTVDGGLHMVLEAPLALVRQTSEPVRDLESHVRATTPTGECTLTARSLGRGRRPETAAFALDFECATGAVTLSTDYGMDLERSAEVVCSIDGHAHVFRQGALDYAVGTPPSLLMRLKGFVQLGAWHVFTGPDHLLFVVSLLLGALSDAQQSRKRALRGTLGVVSGFTLGHSATLIVAGLGIWRPPSALTESLIALSIVIVALRNLVEGAPRGRALFSACFGLVHGFGFASSLAQVGLPARGALSALLAFNIGIELAQVLIVCACFPALAWARGRPWFRSRLLVPGSYVIAAIASVWLFERATGWRLGS